MSSSSTSISVIRSHSPTKIYRTKKDLEKLFDSYIRDIYESREEIKKHQFQNIVMGNICILDIIDFTNLVIRIYTKIHTLNIKHHNSSSHKKSRLLIRYLLFILKNSILEDEVLEGNYSNSDSDKAKQNLDSLLATEFGRDKLIDLPETTLDEELKHKYICSYILSSKINDLKILYQSKSFVEEVNTALTLLNSFNQGISESLHQKILIYKRMK